jgi:hypothetical protein
MCGQASKADLLPSHREARFSFATDFGGYKSGFLDIKIKDKRQVAVIRLKYNDLIVVSAKACSIKSTFL